MRIVFLLSRSHRLCRFARRRNKRNQGNPLTLANPFLLFLLFLREDYYPTRIVVLLSRRNKGNKGNSLTRPMRSPFCSFCTFCGTLLSHADSFYCPAVIGFAASLVEEMKEIKEIQVSDVALGRPSASKLQGQELPKVE